MQRSFKDDYCFLAQEHFYNNCKHPFQVLFIVNDNGDTVGTVTVERIRDLVGISSFCILPEYQNKGIGRATITELRSVYTTDLAVIDCPKEHLLETIYKGMPVIFRD
jgi:GNAT superfamily N-acetyltransferase